MGLSSKFLLLLIVCIAFQTIHAWPQFNIIRWRNLEYEINRAADDAEKDVRKDLLNIKNKAWKETNKMLNKGEKSESQMECLLELHQTFLTQTDESSLKAITCIEETRMKVRGIEEEKLNPRELVSMKNQFKNEVKACRNVSKNEFKAYQRGFSSSSLQCLTRPNSSI